MWKLSLQGEPECDECLDEETSFEEYAGAHDAFIKKVSEILDEHIKGNHRICEMQMSNSAFHASWMGYGWVDGSLDKNCQFWVEVKIIS